MNDFYEAKMEWDQKGQQRWQSCQNVIADPLQLQLIYFSYSCKTEAVSETLQLSLQLKLEQVKVLY